MAVQTQLAQADNRLALLDQAFYEGHRAAGQREVMQVGWVYAHPVDMDQLQRFRDNLAQGLLGRLMERSPLPFGRHRWVTDPHPPGIGVSATVRLRAELGAWFDECTQARVDPESGPGWRLAVTALDDGSTAISLVLSHYVIDGIGGAVAVTEAIWNVSRNLGYPPPRSRHRVQAMVRDASEAIRDTPDVARALVAAVKEARRRAREVDRSTPVRPATATTAADTPLIAPNVWIRLPLHEWNSRAESLGGTHSTLAAALTAKLDERMGRRHGHAAGIPMLLTVNDRTDGDDARAIAVSFVRVGIDPKGVTEDLRGARAAIKQAMRQARDTEDPAAMLVPLTPFTPTAAWRQMAEYARNDPEQPAVCSNLGDTGPAAIRPDGTLCDIAFARGASQHLTQNWLERIGSQVHVYYGTAAEIDLATIYVCAFHPSSVTTRAELRALSVDVLADFGLTAEIE